MAPVVVVEERGGRVGWALLAANGRLLGRSVPTYRSAVELAAAFQELLADRRSLSLRFGRDDVRLTWSWTAALPARSSADAVGQAVARSGRGYLRQDQCRTGAAVFVRSLAGLPPGAVVGRVVNQGRRGGALRREPT